MNVVLLADDEAALLEVFVAVVEEMGHRTLTADNGDDALKLALAHKPDLIISDYMMPRRNGLELLRAVRGTPEVARTPFILISAAAPRGSDEADQYLLKPLTLEAFERAVRTGLAAAQPKVGSGVTTAVARAQDSAPGLARQEMLNWVAHEIKTPLNAARMGTELMQRRLVALGDKSQSRHGEVVLRQLDRINLLINSVLDAAKLEDGRTVLQKEQRDVGEFLLSLVSMWREVRTDFEILLTLPKEPLVLEFDPERVRQVLDNLVSNAAKYGLPSKRIEIGVVLSPATVEIQVRDFGPGMDAAELPHIFSRFHRASGSNGKGHGLGLFIAAALARLHGGTLSATSERGLGSTFTLSLPRVA